VATRGRRWIPNLQILGLPSFWANLGAFPEAWLKPIVYALGAGVLLLLAGLCLRPLLVARLGARPHHAAWLASVVSGIGIVGVLVLSAFPHWLSYVVVRWRSLDANHAWVTLARLAIGTAAALVPVAGSGRRGLVLRILRAIIWSGLAVGTLSGALMFAKLEALAGLTRFAYTTLELGLALPGATAALLLRMIGGISSSIELRPDAAPPDLAGGSVWPRARAAGAARRRLTRGRGPRARAGRGSRRAPS
jgi:hypothetical protein